MDNGNKIINKSNQQGKKDQNGRKEPTEHHDRKEGREISKQKKQNEHMDSMSKRKEKEQQITMCKGNNIIRRS